jgi:hypothetical protein
MSRIEGEGSGLESSDPRCALINTVRSIGFYELIGISWLAA